MTDEQIVRSFLNGIPVCENCRIAMEQDYLTDNFLCPDCGLEVSDFDEYVDNCAFTCLIDELHFESTEEEMEEGCTACGCSAYPDCKTSCNVFDN